MAEHCPRTANQTRARRIEQNLTQSCTFAPDHVCTHQIALSVRDPIEEKLVHSRNFSVRDSSSSTTLPSLVLYSASALARSPHRLHSVCPELACPLDSPTEQIRQKCSQLLWFFVDSPTSQFLLATKLQFRYITHAEGMTNFSNRRPR